MTDAERTFVPYRTFLTVIAPQRHHDQHEAFNALRWLVRTGAAWRSLPNDVSPWAAAPSRPSAGSRLAVVRPSLGTLREVMRLAEELDPQPMAMMLDGLILRSTPESGHCAGYNGHKRTKGLKRHVAVDPIGHMLAARSTPANERSRGGGNG